MKYKEEILFLEFWGKIFKQSFADNQSKVYYKYHYQTCVDAYQKLNNKKPCFGIDLKKGLERLNQYFLFMENDSAPDEIYYKRAQFTLVILEKLEECMMPQLKLF